MQTLGLLVALILGFYQKFLYFSLRFLLLMLMDFLSKFKFFTQASELGCGFLLLNYFSHLFNLLGLLLIFFFCLRLLCSLLLLSNHKKSFIIQRQQFEGGRAFERGEYGGWGVQRNVLEEDSEKGATTVQRNVIESLWWIVVQVESHKKLLEHQLGFLRERLRQFINDQEIQQLQEEQELILG